MGDLTLAEFLAARLGEDSAASREVHEARVCSGCSDGWEAGFDPDRCDCGYPARVLREVAAGRKILAAYQAVLQECATMLGDRRPRKYGEYDGLRFALEAKAATYSAHPDYDPDLP